MIYFYFMYWFACMYICVRALDPLELELQTIDSYYIGTGNWTQVLWKSSQCSHLYSPCELSLIAEEIAVTTKIQGSCPKKIPILLLRKWKVFKS